MSVCNPHTITPKLTQVSRIETGVEVDCLGQMQRTHNVKSYLVKWHYPSIGRLPTSGTDGEWSRTEGSPDAALGDGQCLKWCGWLLDSTPLGFPPQAGRRRPRRNGSLWRGPPSFSPPPRSERDPGWWQLLSRLDFAWWKSQTHPWQRACPLPVRKVNICRAATRTRDQGRSLLLRCKGGRLGR